jgi:hypothetical protein
VAWEQAIPARVTIRNKQAPQEAAMSACAKSRHG